MAIYTRWGNRVEVEGEWFDGAYRMARVVRHVDGRKYSIPVVELKADGGFKEIDAALSASRGEGGTE